MKKIILATALILTICIAAKAQQRPQYTMYAQNNFILNPSIAGIEDYTDIKLAYRTQWVGLKGSPKTMYLTAHAPLGNVEKRHHGIGAYAVSDKTGPSSRNSFDLAYAYHLPITGNLKVSFGLSGGFTQYALNAAGLETIDQGDPAKVNSTIFLPDLNAGFWLYSDKFFLGGSIQQLIPVKLDFNVKVPDVDNNKYLSHYFVTGGYRFPIGYDWLITPSVMVKYRDPAPVSVDFNLKAMYRETIWAGISYRKQDSFSAMMGLNINSLINVAYAYDYTVSALNNYTHGTHEILLGLQLNNTYKVQCPRNVW